MSSKGDGVDWVCCERASVRAIDWRVRFVRALYSIFTGRRIETLATPPPRGKTARRAAAAAGRPAGEKSERVRLPPLAVFNPRQ